MTIFSLDRQHDAEKLKPIIEAAKRAEEAARHIILNEGFIDRDGWRLDVKNDDVVVHYKDIDGKRFFAAQTVVPLCPAIGHRFNWDQVNGTADWNENVKFSTLVGRIGEDIDLTHYASNEVLMVKSREFVVARKSMVVNGAPVVAASSCDTDIVSEAKGCVRGILNLGFGRYEEDPSDSGKSRYDYVVSMDLKGMMPTYLVNQVMGKMVLMDVENHRKNLIEHSKKI